MGVPNRLNSVPRRMLPIYKKVVDAIDEVCGRYLNQEYHDSARTMTQALCRKRPSPLTSGQPRTWACAIVKGQLSRRQILVSAHDDDRPMCRIWSWRKDSPHQGASDRRCAPNQAREG
jgi:hypothetical protein